METLLIKSGDGAGMARAAKIISDGGLVIIPTETVYGLGCSAYSATAAYNVFEAKGRPHDNPLIVHISEPSEAENFAHTTDLYYKLARQFMPGPLTVILKKKDIIPAEVTAGGATVGVRCPAHPAARDLIRLAGVPIAAPSANLSGSPSPTAFEHCVRDMTGRVDAIIDGGECEVGLESTVVLLTGEDSLKILRPGAVDAGALSCVCSDVTVADGLGDGEKPLSPGMKYRHYAPKAPLVILDGTDEAVTAFVDAEMQKGGVFFICYDEDADKYGKYAYPIGKRSDEAAHAKNLFAALRFTDELGDANIKTIYTYMPRDGGTGLMPAIYNRLIRAADHTVLKV